MLRTGVLGMDNELDMRNCFAYWFVSSLSNRIILISLSPIPEMYLDLPYQPLMECEKSFICTVDYPLPLPVGLTPFRIFM